MRVVLIFTNINLGKILRVTFHPPLGLAMIAAVVEEAGYDVTVIDAAALNLNYKNLLERLHEIDPDVIGVTTNISICSQSLDLSRFIRRHFSKVKLVFGGPWASAVYKMLLQKNFCDYVIVGEGEHAFINLLKVLEENALPKEIPGIAFLDINTKEVQLEPPQLIEDLDSLPFPAWHLLPSPKKYFFHNFRKIFYPIMTSRGCPYQCNFCTKIVHGTRVRFRSVENVIAEIQYLKERFSVDELLISDDNFTFDPKRAMKICNEIIKNNFNVSISFHNGLRADTLTLKLVKKLKQAGTQFISIGVESGNQEVVNKIGKRLDLNAVKHAVKIVKKEKIFLAALFMLGHSFDSVETMNDTINFAIQIDADASTFSTTTPFPGTKLYNLIKQDGRFLTSIQDVDRGYNTYVPNFEIYNLRAEDVEKMYKQAFRRFYLRPRKLLSLVKQMRRFSMLRYIMNYGILILLNLLNVNR